jgi:hypothetical protein
MNELLDDIKMNTYGFYKLQLSEKTIQVYSKIKNITIRSEELRNSYSTYYKKEFTINKLELIETKNKNRIKI